MFAVSTGKVEITPGVGFPMAGYGVDAPRTSTGTNQPIYARCTILWDDNAPFVVVTADVLGFRKDTHQAIRAAVTALGIPTEAFVLTATHTHNGPVLTEGLDPFVAYDLENLSAVDTYTTWLVLTIATLVAQTRLAPRTPCTLDYTVLSADFSFNREGLPYVETDVPVLVAREAPAMGNEFGDPRAVLFSYGTHPVAGNVQTLFDPDYPGTAIAVVEAAWPAAFAQFLTGPAGDQNPLSTAGFAASDEFGSSLGATIQEAIGAPGREILGPIAGTYSEVVLPLDTTPTAPNVARVRADYAARAANPTVIGFERRHAARMVQLIDATPIDQLESGISLPVQTWEFGGLTVIFSGGEIVSGYAVVLRREFGGSDALWLVGYSNEVPGYIPSDELLDHVCYAGGIGADFPGIAASSMAVYDHWAHFLRKVSPDAADGVEQTYLGHVRALLGAT